MLGKTDGAGAGDGTGYLDMVSFIKSNGASPKEDLVELWRRIVFNMAVSNTDDHLRNHGFLLGKNGWRLSPLYDVNPVEEGNELALNVSETDNRISIDLAIETAHFYGIKEADAKRMVEEILSTVRDNWERLAKQYGLSRTDIEDKRPAFEICYRH
jgi:serine/threonine-protein kinase HipA